MKIEKYINDQGEWRCFVVSNSHVSRNGLARMIASCRGVTITRTPKFFDSDVFCEFEMNGHKFYIEEPYGDNTTYDVIAPEPDLEEMDVVAKHIEATNPIKSGDFGHKLYFITTYALGAALLFFIVRGIWNLFSG